MKTIGAILVLAGAVILSAPAQADYPDAFYNAENGRYYLPSQTRHLKLDLERLKERQRERANERAVERREAERHDWARREPEVRSWRRVEQSDRRREHEHRGRCLDRMITVGDQHLSIDGAKDQAIKAIRQMIRFSAGERFTDIGNADNVTFRCVQSSIGEALGQSLHRCEISLEACTAPRISGDK